MNTQQKFFSYQKRQSIAKDIAKSRKEKGYSLYRLSVLSGIRPDVIKQIELGEKNYTVDTLIQVVQGLNIKIVID